MYEFKTRVNFDFGLHRYFSRCFFFFFFISYRGLWEQVLQTFLPNNGYTLSYFSFIIEICERLSTTPIAHSKLTRLNGKIRISSWEILSSSDKSTEIRVLSKHNREVSITCSWSFTSSALSRHSSYTEIHSNYSCPRFHDSWLFAWLYYMCIPKFISIHFDC